MNQCSQILEHMRRYGAITQAEAYERYGVTRLSVRIWDLRRLGYDISSTTTEGRNRYGDTVRYKTYRLEGAAGD